MHMPKMFNSIKYFSSRIWKWLPFCYDFELTRHYAKETRNGTPESRLTIQLSRELIFEWKNGNDDNVSVECHKGIYIFEGILVHFNNAVKRFMLIKWLFRNTITLK